MACVGALRARLLLVLLAAGCARPPASEAIKQQVAALQAAIESRDADAIAALLTDDFIGNDGLDRTGIRRMAALMLMQHQTVGVTLGALEIDVQGERATVRTAAALTGGSGRLLPDSAGLHQVTSGWRLDDGEWRMYSLEWSRP